MSKDKETEKRVTKARNDDELALIRALKSAPAVGCFVNPIQSTSEEDQIMHYDIVVNKLYDDGTHDVRHIDAKSILGENVGTGNYSIGEENLIFLKTLRLPTYDLAFRVFEGEEATGKFYIVDAKEALEKCEDSLRRLVDRKHDRPYYLIPLGVVLKRCRAFLVEPEEFG